MRLAVSGLLPGDPREITPNVVRGIRELGFTAASWHFGSLDFARDDWLAEARAVLAAEGLTLCQLLPPQYESLVHPEVARRAAGVDALRRVCEVAAQLGAPNVYVRPGSLNPAGPWTPHPDNHREETRDRLIDSLKQLAPRAEDAGVDLAIEGHVVSPLDTPSVTRAVIDAVDSPALKFNLDTVNYLPTLDDAYHPESILAELERCLGGFIVAAHIKDVTVQDRLVVHIDETPPGQGYLDQGEVARVCQHCAPEAPFIIEHLSRDKVPAAREAVLRQTAAAGIALEAA